jgi:hypothetical protein
MASPLRRFAAGLTILLGAGCASNADPGNNFVPGTSGGNGGSGGITFPNFDGGGGMGGFAPRFDGPAGGSMTEPDAGRDGGADLPPPGSAGIGDKCTISATCSGGGLCAADIAGGGYCTADCTATGACPAGSACVAASESTKICVKTCAQPSACRAEHLCLAGYCLPRCTEDADCISQNCNVATGLCGDSRVGKGCATDGDCGQYPAFCDKTRPEGYCSLPCGGAMNLGCPEEANCVSGGSAGACLKSCTGPADCRAGFLCLSDSGGTQSCFPPCARDSDCAAGRRCQLPAGLCVEGGPARGSLGGPCANNADCATLGAGGFCTPEANGFPGGYCSVPCDAVTCATGLCVETSTNMNNCLSTCAAPADCRSGYTCFSLDANDPGICFPKCTADTDCIDPEPVCDRTSGYCVPRPVAGGGNLSDEVVNLTPNGPITVGNSTLSDRLIVTIPADAVSVNFVGQAVSDPSVDMAVYRLEQSTDDFATATRLYDLGSISNMVQLPPALIPGSFSVLYPNSPTAPFTPSSPAVTVKLAIRVLASRPTTMNVLALVKHSPNRALTSGKIDLNLFFVGLPDLNAASARTDARFAQIFDRVKSTWGKAGIQVGTVNYLDIGGADGARFSDLNETELGELMTRSRVTGAKDDAMNVFFVHTITGDTLGGYVILGQSAGLPGVPLRGTTGSGLAVTTADFPDGLADIADTWGHEGGHSLGLFHTSELGGTAFDPLPDTPECARARDLNRDKIMQPGECRSFGAENLMFWTSTASIPNSDLSPNQSFVMLRNPAVH